MNAASVGVSLTNAQRQVTLTYMAPPLGTGRVRFRALIKRGVANTGSFHYPSTGAGADDLVLEEMDMAVAEAPHPVTLAAEAGVSCALHSRAELGYNCDGERLTGINSAEALASAVSGYHVGTNGLTVADCAAAAPGIDENGTWLFQVIACHASTQKEVASYINTHVSRGEVYRRTEREREREREKEGGGQ